MELTVKAKNYFEFRKLTKLIYDLGYKFDTENKYNSFLMWIGYYGLNPIRGFWFKDYDNSKRIKYCDYIHSYWNKVDYVTFSEFKLMIYGEV